MIVEKFELLTMFSPNYELFDSSCCAITQILPFKSIFYPHNDTCIITFYYHNQTISILRK